MNLYENPAINPNSRSEEEGKLPVGAMTTLPTLYVQNETNPDSASGADLRFRKRSNDSTASGTTGSTFGTPGSLLETPLKKSCQVGDKKPKIFIATD